MRPLLIVMVAAGLGTAGLYGQESLNVQLLATFNQYSATGYNDCWGYTAPDGREYALLGVRSGTSILDITDTPTLNEIAFIPNPAASSSWKDIKTYRHYAYVVNESGGGLQIIDLSGLPDTAFVANTYTGFLRSHNIYIDTTDALLYAEGDSAGIAVRVLSLANPTQPVQVSVFGIECHDIFAANKRAYVSEGTMRSFSIYDMTNPSSPALLKRDTIPSGGYVHNAWLSDDGIYLMTTEETVGKTVKLWNVSNLNSITLAGEYLGPSSLAHNTHIKGNYAYISHYKDGLRIVDISAPPALTEAGFYDTYVMSLPGDFHGAWGAFPFFRSGKILISDIETGLYVVFFAGAVTSAPGNPEAVPDRFQLDQNFPNPFNPETVIRYHLPAELSGESGFISVRLSVFDVLGREVAVLVDGEKAGGRYEERWNASSMPSGIYFARLVAGSFQETRRMLLVR